MTQRSSSLRRPIPVWVIPIIYIAVSAVLGLTLPRLEHAYLPRFQHGMSVSTAQAFLSAASSGMMALTAIAFAIAFLVVQFSATAYSKRFILLSRNSYVIAHALGMCFATFVYALATLTWVDRFRNGTVPAASTLLVGVLIVASLFLLALLVHNLADLRVTRVLRIIGDEGRAVIAACLTRDSNANPRRDGIQQRVAEIDTSPRSDALRYAGPPRAVVDLHVDALIACARETRSILIVHCAIGDTISDGTLLVSTCGGAAGGVPAQALLSAIQLAPERRFERDPKYPMRLLVDTAIMALSPAINDPTTAVQALDEIEDLLHRIGTCDLDDGYAFDRDGALRVVTPAPVWNDYLSLAFDEIRMCGSGSLQVLRRLRSACLKLSSSLDDQDRRASVQHYLEHIDEAIEASSLDPRDKISARQADPQGLGLTREVRQTNRS